jgi:predicted PurR-regulated permease PerM
VRVALRVLLIVAGVALALWVLHALAFLLFVLMVAGLFAYVVAPMVEAIQRPVRIAGRSRRASRVTAIAVVYVFLAAAGSSATMLLLPSATEQLEDMIARAPGYAQSIQTWELGWSRYYKRLRIPVELRQRIDESVLAADDAAVTSIRGSLMALVGALQGLPWLILIPILAFFFLKDAATLRRSVVVALPFRIRLRGHRLFEEVNATLAAYVRAQLLACALVGTLCGLGLAALGVPYPVLLGALAGVLEFVPLVGPLLFGAIAVIVGLLHPHVPVIWIMAFLVLLRVVEDYVIYPRLMRRGVEIHPLAVIVAVLAGAELGGVAGMFLAIPIVAIVTVVSRHWRTWHGSDAAAETPLPSAALASPISPSRQAPALSDTSPETSA